LAEDRRGERQGKGLGLTGSGGDQEDVPEAHFRMLVGGACAVEASLGIRRHRHRSFSVLRDVPGGCPGFWPGGGARRRGGVSPVCGSCTERGKANVDTAIGVAGPEGREGERANGGNPRHWVPRRRLPADRLVVAAKLLLGWGWCEGGERLARPGLCGVPGGSGGK